MKIQIRAHDMTLTIAQRAAVKRRLTLVFGRFGERVDRIAVRFSDGDGDRGGIVKCCHLEVGLQPGNVRVEVADTDLLVALDHAAHRAARSVARALDREGLWDVTPASIRKPRKGDR